MRSRLSLPFSTKSFLIAASVLLLIALSLAWFFRHRPPKPFVGVRDVAGSGLKLSKAALPDYFGVAVDGADRVLFSDGTADSISLIDKDGSLRTITTELDTPSAIAFAPDGSLIVANTSAHTIVRVEVETGRVAIIAGSPNVSGFADGMGSAARFNGPIGVAVSPDGRIFVADTYNDRIRVISKDGWVSTLAGGEQGFSDGAGSAAKFDTPCGVAINTDGSLLIADTSNNRIRRVTVDGQVTTLTGTGEDSSRDGAAQSAAFSEPVAIAVRRDGAIFVADAGSSSLRGLKHDPQAPQSSELTVATIAGGYPNGIGDLAKIIGLLDGEIIRSEFNRPAALAFQSDDTLIFAEGGSGLVRALTPSGSRLGLRSKPEVARIEAAEIRRVAPPRWPFDPPQARRDVAGTFGEIRGELMTDHDAWFHNGLDIAGAYGETARAIFSERVVRPISIEGVGTTRERLRLPLIGYIHIRLGRDQNNQPLGNFPEGAITFRRDDQGQIIGARIRRGTRINAGDALGTLNRLNHVHLIAGPAGSESNALAALQFPGLADTVPPTIESVAIQNVSLDNQIEPAGKQKRIPLTGRSRIIVRAFDQVDGNPSYRRLGLYRLGYQILKADNSPAKGFDQPRYNIVFQRLPVGLDAVRIAYSMASQSGYEGKTIFDYIITNVVRDGQAREDFLDASQLAPGDYTVRVFAEDFFGNRAQRDLAVTVN